MTPDQRYHQLPYVRCGRSGLLLPRVSLGLWHNFGGVDDPDNSRGVLLHAFDRGITHFDLANNYGPPPGSAEETMGRILRQDLISHRDELIISTKAGFRMWPGPYGEWGSRKNLLASLDQSLRRLGLDYVDIFYSHRPDPETPLEETLGALAHAVRSGKALYVGISRALRLTYHEQDESNFDSEQGDSGGRRASSPSPSEQRSAESKVPRLEEVASPRAPCGVPLGEAGLPAQPSPRAPCLGRGGTQSCSW